MPQDHASTLELLRSHSLTSLLQAEIERMILDGAFAAGERLNENALAAKFNVSRAPVREACRALAELGLVRLVPNRGVFIREVTREEAEELYDVRAGLFGLAGRLLAARITKPQLGELDRLLDRMDEAAARVSFDDYYPWNLAFHDFILRSTGNDRLIKTYHHLVKELHLFRARGLVQGGGLAVSNKEHREIVRALAARDPRHAFEACFQHVVQGKGRMLAAIEARQEERSRR